MSNKARICEFCRITSSCPCETEKNSKTCKVKKIKENNEQQRPKRKAKS